MGDIAKDLTAGTVGGAAQLICGHPFDTIKVKLQSQPARLPGQPPKYAGAMDAVRQTLAAEGPRGLYKGMGAPLATVAAFNAVLFTVRGQMEALLRAEPGASLTVNQQIICGAGAGVAVSFLACPTELIKCRQVFCFHSLPVSLYHVIIYMLVKTLLGVQLLNSFDILLFYVVKLIPELLPPSVGPFHRKERNSRKISTVFLSLISFNKSYPHSLLKE